MEVTEFAKDAFLDGRLRIAQPTSGYRAATDPVLLAAATPARPGMQVLDLGCGAGVAGLCLACRVGGLTLHGLEIQPDYAALAKANAAANGVPMTVHEGDLRAMPPPLRQLGFDAVILNPPWHPGDTLASPVPAKDRANRLDVPMSVWIAAALTRTRPGGWIVTIHRAESLPETLGALGPRAGDVAVLPLAARHGRAAKRVIVKARKGTKGPFRLAAPLVLHDGPDHGSDSDDFSQAARAILRDGAALDF